MAFGLALREIRPEGQLDVLRSLVRMSALPGVAFRVLCAYIYMHVLCMYVHVFCIHEHVLCTHVHVFCTQEGESRRVCFVASFDPNRAVKEARSQLGSVSLATTATSLWCCRAESAVCTLCTAIHNCCCLPSKSQHVVQAETTAHLAASNICATICNTDKLLHGGNDRIVDCCRFT
jgi:hypothetical protein